MKEIHPKLTRGKPIGEALALLMRNVKLADESSLALIRPKVEPGSAPAILSQLQLIDLSLALHSKEALEQGELNLEQVAKSCVAHQDEFNRFMADSEKKHGKNIANDIAMSFSNGYSVEHLVIYLDWLKDCQKQDTVVTSQTSTFGVQAQAVEAQTQEQPEVGGQAKGGQDRSRDDDVAKVDNGGKDEVGQDQPEAAAQLGGEIPEDSNKTNGGKDQVGQDQPEAAAPPGGEIPEDSNKTNGGKDEVGQDQPEAAAPPGGEIPEDSNKTNGGKDQVGQDQPEAAAPPGGETKVDNIETNGGKAQDGQDQPEAAAPPGGETKVDNSETNGGKAQDGQDQPEAAAQLGGKIPEDSNTTNGDKAQDRQDGIAQTQDVKMAEAEARSDFVSKVEAAFVQEKARLMALNLRGDGGLCSGCRLVQIDCTASIRIDRIGTTIQKLPFNQLHLTYTSPFPFSSLNRCYS